MYSSYFRVAKIFLYIFNLDSPGVFNIIFGSWSVGAFILLYSCSEITATSTSVSIIFSQGNHSNLWWFFVYKSWSHQRWHLNAFWIIWKTASTCMWWPFLEKASCWEVICHTMGTLSCSHCIPFLYFMLVWPSLDPFVPVLIWVGIVSQHLELFSSPCLWDSP